MWSWCAAPAGGKRPKTTPQPTPTSRGVPSKKPKAAKKAPAKKVPHYTACSIGP